MKNIPEAFQLRKNWNGEKEKKMVEIDPFFAGLITNSKMLSCMPPLAHLCHYSEPQRARLLGLRQARPGWAGLAKAAHQAARISSRPHSHWWEGARSALRKGRARQRWPDGQAGRPPEPVRAKHPDGRAWAPLGEPALPRLQQAPECTVCGQRLAGPVAEQCLGQQLLTATADLQHLSVGPISGTGQSWQTLSPAALQLAGK